MPYVSQLLGSGGGRLTERRKVPPPEKMGPARGIPERGSGRNRKLPAGGNAMKPKGRDHLCWLKFLPAIGCKA